MKADGLFNLLRAPADMEVKALVVLLVGGRSLRQRGQADYSSGNDFLCKVTLVVVRGRQAAGSGMALDWTAWGGIGMATRGSIPEIDEAGRHRHARARRRPAGGRAACSPGASAARRWSGAAGHPAAVGRHDRRARRRGDAEAAPQRRQARHGRSASCRLDLHRGLQVSSHAGPQGRAVPQATTPSTAPRCCRG